MSPDLFKKLDELQPTADALNRESEDLNEIVERVEKRLAELGLGVDASVQLFQRDTTYLDPDDSDQTERKAIESTWLSYERHAGQWALWVQMCVYKAVPDPWGDDSVEGSMVQEGEKRLLSSASRNVRIDALAMLPELVDQLKQNAEEKIQKLRASKKQISE